MRGPALWIVLVRPSLHSDRILACLPPFLIVLPDLKSRWLGLDSRISHRFALAFFWRPHDRYRPHCDTAYRRICRRHRAVHHSELESRDYCGTVRTPRLASIQTRSCVGSTEIDPPVARDIDHRHSQQKLDLVVPLRDSRDNRCTLEPIDPVFRTASWRARLSCICRTDRSES